MATAAVLDNEGAPFTATATLLATVDVADMNTSFSPAPKLTLLFELLLATTVVLAN